MLTVQIKGLTTDLQLFSKGALNANTEVCVSVNIKIWGIEYHIFSFSHFFVAAISKMPQEREYMPRIQPTKIYMHDGPEIMFLGLFLRGFLTKFWHKYKSQQPNFGIKW